MYNNNLVFSFTFSRNKFYFIIQLALRERRVEPWAQLTVWGPTFHFLADSLAPRPDRPGPNCPGPNLPGTHQTVLQGHHGYISVSGKSTNNGAKLAAKENWQDSPLGRVRQLAAVSYQSFLLNYFPTRNTICQFSSKITAAIFSTPLSCHFFSKSDCERHR